MQIAKSGFDAYNHNLMADERRVYTMISGRVDIPAIRPFFTHRRWWYEQSL
jgi:hypothetical protein